MAITKLPFIPVRIPTPWVHFSFEGIDGVGKTTQSIRVEKELLSRGVPIQLGKCPSPTLLGEFLRHNMKSLKTWERNALFLMDMIAILRKNEGTNRVLIWDRYKDSNRVANKDMSLEEAEECVSCLPETNRTFLLDLDPEIVVAQRKDSLHEHSLDLNWQRVKRKRYLDLADKYKNRIIIVDAVQEEEVITRYITDRIVNDLKALGIL